jgi:uncharacterized membrane protein
MKTAPATSLERTETGGYVGAIGGESLSDLQKQAIRKVLSQATEPLHLGTLAGKAGIAMNTPTMQQSVSRFVSVYLLETSKEVERTLEANARGREIFRGFSLTAHGRDLIAKGLV